MLGVSVYLQDLDIEYLEAAAEIGIEYVFTSLHIPEEDFSDMDFKLMKLLDTCKRNNINLVPDISPVTFEKLKIENQDTEKLRELGFKYLRLDYGFDDFEKIINLQNNFQIMLNASVINREYLEQANNAGVDLSQIKMAHNFYPKTNTGLSDKFFSKLNCPYLDYNIDVLAFVPGDLLKRFPLYEGLPTLEKHRGMNPYVAAVELMHTFFVKDIIIGDTFAKISTLKKINMYMEQKILTIPVYLDKKYHDLYDQKIRIRRDIPEKIIRLSTPRISDIKIESSLNKIAGMITIENRLAKRYSGEIQICRETLPFSPTSNMVGFVHPEYIDLLNFIDSDTSIIFEKI